MVACAVAVVLLFCAAASRASAEQRNLYGEALGVCDRSAADDPRYPTTGFRRDNLCATTPGDAGAHFVCVRLPEARVPGTAARYSPFWTVTGQAPTAAEAASWPKPGPWCICMWAFAAMVQKAPAPLGDFTQSVDCAATNVEVALRYDVESPSQRDALHRLCAQCRLVASSRDQRVVSACRAAAQQA